LSVESDIEYGFHGTNAWERWQLLNFYKHVFNHHGFNAAAMQQAKVQGKAALENYLDTLVPAWQRSIANWVLADAIFPKLGAKMEVTGETLECFCVVHDVWAPEGLDWSAPQRTREVAEQERDEIHEENGG